MYSSGWLAGYPNMFTTKTRARTETVFSRRQVEGLIADGRSIIILDQRVLKVDSWLKYHPGGDKAIMHMVGRDATDEVNGCVSRASNRIILIVLLQLSLPRSTQTNGAV